MCKSIDAAVAMVNYAIDLADEDSKPEYLMDYVKLHKLLFLAQCYTVSRYNMSLFQEGISAHNCGPYVDGINEIAIYHGYSSLRDKILSCEETGIIYLPLSISRKEAVEYTVKKYGYLSADQLVAITKNTPAYKHFDGNYSAHLQIPYSLLQETGKAVFAND